MRWVSLLPLLLLWSSPGCVELSELKPVVTEPDASGDIVPGDVTTVDVPDTGPPDLPLGTADAYVAITAGATFSLVLRGDGLVYGWGAANNGELPSSAAGAGSGPRRLDLPPAVRIAAGADHACAMTPDRQVLCWGNNRWGQVGTSGGDPVVTPTVVYAGADAVYAGPSATCVTSVVTGALECWGRPLDDKDPIQARYSDPEPTGLSGATEVHIGDGHICALVNTELFCWGDNSQGAVGVGADAGDFVPTPARVDLAAVTLIGGGNKHSCAVDNTFELLCWGDNDQLQLGLSQVTQDQFEPRAVPVPSLSDVAAIAGGARHNCVQDEVGDVFCAGDNVYKFSSIDKQLPLWDLGAREDLPRVALITSGRAHMCGVSQLDSSVWCWGDNSSAQMGTGGPPQPSDPVQVPLPSFP